MSKIIFNKIVAKLERLEEYFQYLEKIQKINKKKFLADYHFFGLAERYLQLCIEILLDIGKMVIVAERLRKPEDNEDIFIVLSENKILSAKAAQQLVGIAGFRNILVHDYENIDRRIVYEKLQENLKDFQKFQKAILRYLNKK